MNSREQLFRAVPWISTSLLLATAVGVWKLVTVASDVSPFILPSPESVAAALVELVARPDTWTLHARVTLTEAVTGFASAVVSGVAVGVILGKVIWLERAVRPMVVVLQVIPKVALVPLFVVWFGFGMASKIFIAGILAFFPIMLNVLLGVRSIDPAHLDVMRSLHAGRWATFWSLELHSMLPYLFAGMEVGVVFAVIGAIVGEYLGGSQGLGYMVVVTLNALNAPELFAIIILLATLGYGLFLAINVAKRLLIPWHESVSNSNVA
jgi:NitT/TauT family transport system permease protein